MLSNSWFKKYLLPGFIFQSLVIGGGYGTGRELVEFFLLLGPKNGILGMIVSRIFWCGFRKDFSSKFVPSDNEKQQYRVE